MTNGAKAHVLYAVYKVNAEGEGSRMLYTRVFEITYGDPVMDERYPYERVHMYQLSRRERKKSDYEK